MTSNSQGKAVLIDNGIRMRRDKMKDGLMRRGRDRELTVSQKMQRENQSTQDAVRRPAARLDVQAIPPPRHCQSPGAVIVVQPNNER
ncbi:unnamed protein product [Fusarium graminearum]|nr:unnamed protein product [Fusarium graminearum]